MAHESDVCDTGNGELDRRSGVVVRYPVAVRGDVLVWALELAASQDRPRDLSCVGCGGSVGLRAGQRNRPHFAHRSGEQCSAGETALHAVTIRVIAESLAAASAASQPYSMTWNCGECGAGRSGNLARHHNASIVADQVWKDRFRPDLLVRAADHKAMFAIEVVVTHEPELETLAAYAADRLPVIVVWPTWEWLDQLRSGLPLEDWGRPGPPAIGRRAGSKQHGWVVVDDRCKGVRHPMANAASTCASCHAATRVIALEVATGLRCYKCRRDVPVLDVVASDGDGTRLLAASDPSLRGIEPYARQLGVVLRDEYSKTAGGRYRMHHCPHCGAKQGDFFVTSTTEGARRVDTTKPRTSYLTCENGHWTHLGDRAWPTGGTVERFAAHRSGSLWGNAPGDASIAEVRRATNGNGSISLDDAIRRMVFGSSW